MKFNFLFAILLPYIPTYCQLLKFQKGLLIDECSQCLYTPHSPCKIYDIELIHGKYGTSLSSKSNCTKIFPVKFQVEAIGQKCKSKESLDTCESFKPIKTQGACALLEMKNQAWTPFIDSFTPELKCPIQPNYYEQKNAYFAPGLFILFPIDDYYWKIKFVFYSEKNVKMFAMCVSVKIIKLRL